MVEQEFWENQGFKYPEEYLVKDSEEEKKREEFMVQQVWSVFLKLEEQAERKRKEFEEVERSRLMATRTKVEMERDRY